jgi:hypothetical protein
MYILESGHTHVFSSHRGSNRSARFDERVELVHVRLHGIFIIVLFAAHGGQHVGFAGEHSWEGEDGRRCVVTAFVHQVQRRRKAKTRRRRREEEGNEEEDKEEEEEERWG